MRLPSVDILIQSARRAAERFPMVLLAGAVSAFAASCLFEEVGDAESFVRLMLVATLGIPLFIALDLHAERRGWAGARRVMGWGVGLALLAAFFLMSSGWSEGVQGRRYVQTSVAFHLLVAFLPFVGRREPNGFWQYNRALLERVLVAAVYMLTLYAGLALAVGALDRLLGVPIPDATYAHMWFVAAFVFSTWVFLAGVPDDFAALEARTDYPKDLKKFAQYVLIPLVVVYLVILTLYLGKIVITTEWPSGWIGYLVSGVAVVGILSVLLIHPIAEREEARWVTHYVRWFYVGLLPAVVMLLLAIWKRIDQYGVTENRYFIVVLALWLAGIAVYFGATRSRNIGLIPISLCLLAVVTLAGPWSAYAVSERSQVARLRGLLERNGMWADGAARPAGETAVSRDDQREMSSVLHYLARTHGLGAVEEWFGVEVATEPAEWDAAASRSRVVMQHLGLEYFEASGYGRVRENWRRYAANRPAFDVAGFDLGVALVDLSARDTVWGGGYRVVLDSVRAQLVVTDSAGPSLAFALDTLQAYLPEERADTVRPVIRLHAESGALRAALLVWRYEATVTDTTFVPRRLVGQLLLRR